ncbi:MAG: hypothetical protein HUU35_09895, partial [Armatimonadetes bacterium]|nr:hypothetical protein [Armatimonadota bacterium]
MKLLKRLALPVMALFVLTVVGCNQQSADEGGEGLREGDTQSLAAKRSREEANTKLQANYMRVGQALTLTQMGIQSKLH